MTAVPAALVNSTVQYAVPALSGRAVLAATVSPSVAVLTQATLRTLFMTRIMLAAALLGTAAAMTVVTIPIFRPSLRAGSQAASTDEANAGTPSRNREPSSKAAPSPRPGRRSLQDPQAGPRVQRSPLALCDQGPRRPGEDV